MKIGCTIIIMRNTGKKTNLRFIVQSILFVCMVLSPYSSHAKLSYNKTEWNGSATVKVEGNYATVVANGLNGAIEFKGITVSEFDVPSSIISQTYGTTIQTISDLTTTFGVYYDAKTKILHVKTTPYTGAISIENDGVCYQTDAEMSVVNVDLADYAIEWGTANGTDTTWIPSAKNQKDVSYTMDTLNPVRFVTKLTPASANGNVIVNELIVSPVLFGCGFSMGVSDNTICLSKDVTLSTSYTNASKYEWKDDDGRIYATTNVPTATITPEKSGTYEFAVYGDGLKIASSQVRVKSMGECGFKVTAAKEYVCLGASVEISTDFTEASSYVLMDENNKTVATSLTPSITFIPTENSTYSLYADNFFVGKVSIKVKECTFFIAPKYPIASCLQDTNILMAAGTAVLDDIEKNVFTWERSENNIDWKLLPTTSYRLPIATTED